MSDVRRHAQKRRIEIGLLLDEPTPGEQVLQACQAAIGFERCFLPPGHDLLAGAVAVLDVNTEAIYQDETRPPEEAQADAAHEFAHVWLHRDSGHCTGSDLDPLGGGEPTTGAWSKVDGYSPAQKRECEANLFASELLLPGPLARRLFQEGRTAQAIAEELGLPCGLVQRQLMDSVLLPQLGEEAAEEVGQVEADPILDAFQQEAAHVAQGPLLLGAGPGTGKTKTLVGRCRFLTQTLGVPAEKILALTFSRQAANEMRERLALSGIGTSGAGPWVGTFHAFGLDVLRRFGERLGLSGGFKLLDTLDAVTLLENHLPELDLDVLDNLYDPAISLGGIVKQISRAKDELCSPARYAELCVEMSVRAELAAQELAAKPVKKSGGRPKTETAPVEKALLQARKAAEVARAYAVYERLMAENGFLDFADLIYKAVQILEENADVQVQLQAEYPHVLADEYQDVNRACARLVRLVAGEEAAGLWAVGDHRQSIYRFRGASPANVAAFKRDYPNGQRLELGVNYRSRTPIVELFGVAARGMGPTPAGKPATPPETGGGGVSGAEASGSTGPTSSSLRFGGGTGGAGEGGLWHAHRGENLAAPCPAVTLAVAPDEDGQADGIARHVNAMKAAGLDYRDQVLLCRTNPQAAALAERLSERDVPVLYLGDLLDRAEVKDLLCLLSLFADGDGSGLLRVAAWPEYNVPRADVLALLERLPVEQATLLALLQGPGLQDGLARLGRHLAELETMENDPAALLRHYLFGLSGYLRDLYASEPKPFLQMQKGLAIHHLLGVAGGFDRRVVAPAGSEGAGNRVREFLSHLRRLTASGEVLRPAAPPEAESIDAVRIMTAHAAKGLEFPVVFVPNLGAGQFPARGRHDGIPTPLGLADQSGEDGDEEDCLFFVALSRARETLVLSRSETKDSDKAVKPSPLLELIQPWFDVRGIAETAWPAGRNAVPDDDVLAPIPDPLPTYSVSALETYLRCPRQYHYKHALKIEGTFSLAGYPQFHACVRSVLHWMEDEQALGRSPSESEIEARLASVWADSGPVGHRHEAKYLAAASQMLRTALGMRQEGEERLDPRTLHATLPYGRVQMRPDVVRIRPSEGGALVVARRLTGKPGGDDHTNVRLALFRRAAQETHPDRPLRLHLHYLLDGSAPEIEAPTTPYKLKLEADRVAKYENAARGIALGLFPANEGDDCKTCGYGLICPL